MNSLTEENYLKALFNIANKDGEVNVAELSKSLDLKMPTVTSMVKKLARKKLVHYESYKPLRLTEKGKKEEECNCSPNGESSTDMKIAMS